MIWTPATLLQTLSGAWKLDRAISDAVSGAPIATLQGSAEFTLQGGNDALYAENGTLTMGQGPSVSANRLYFYRQQPDGVAIYFDEARERLFQTLVLSGDGKTGLQARDLHLCAPDRYEGRYHFLPDGGFEIEYRVTGPHKSYVSRTVYRRS
jgi:Family of unknown function (DUF6314)